MAASIGTVTAWIAGLTFTGIGVRDITAIPEVVHPQQCPLLAPDPAGFVSGVSHARLSLRVNTARSYSLTYTLHYVLFFGTAGEGVSLYSRYAGMAAAWGVVVTTILASETPNGAYDIRPTGTPTFGPVRDDTGTVFHGCKFDLLVTEFN